MRWTSKIRTTKCTAKELGIKKACRLEFLVKDRRQRRTGFGEGRGVVIINQSSDIIEAQEIRKLGN